MGDLEFDSTLIQCVPDARQLRHQQTEFYAFIHFTVNTFTDKEWGDGTESESVFNPASLDAEQWVRAVKSAGMKGLILTAKHHDGFCLWPSAYTEHSVKNSPYKNGKGDVVREAAEACRKGGIKFGVYLSPWDRNSPLYGQGVPYDDYFCAQLRELLTDYGELFSVWFDGACGEGPNGKKQVYDWERYYAVVRELQPDACISICGPDVRWCGNESGKTRLCEWSVIPTGFNDNGETKIAATDEDLGSRTLLQQASGLAWKHAEVDVSIRPGWFWHKSENQKVKSLKELEDIYFRSVGGNCTLLLNIPPDVNGHIADKDVKRLEQLGRLLAADFANDLASDAVFEASLDDGIHTVENVRTDSYDTYFKTPDGENEVTITVSLPEAKKIHIVEIKENILFSQRIERFSIEYHCGKGWKHLYDGTTVGYKKYARFRPVLTDSIKIHIIDSRVCPVISHIAIY